MWYSRIIESATAWEVLSTKEIVWQGTFEKTFKDFYFYKGSTKLPTIVALRKFIDFMTKKSSTRESILEDYVSKINTDYVVKWDLSAFIRQLIIFIDDYISKGKLDSDLFEVVNFLGYLRSFYKDGEFELGGSCSGKDYSNATNTFGMGFTALRLILDRGFVLNPGLEMMVAQDRDISVVGTNDSEDRQQVKKMILERKPYLKFFKSPEQILYWIEQYFSVPDVANSYAPSKNDIKKATVEFLKSSPQNYEKQVTKKAVENISDLDSDFFWNISVEMLIDVLDEITNENLQVTNSVKNLVSRIASNANEEILYIKNYILKKNPIFMNYIKENDFINDDRYIVSGYSTEENVEKFLERNPEMAEKLFERGILSSFEKNKVDEILQKSKEAKEQIARDSNAFLKEAEKKGLIKIFNVADKFHYVGWKIPEIQTTYDEEGNAIYKRPKQTYELSYFDRMLEESGLSGIDKEDLKNYASHMKIYEYNEPVLRQFAKENNVKKVIVGQVNLFDEKWSGLFVPRLSTEEGIIPAIFIKTNAYDTLEYHQQLSKNIGMDPAFYTESTRRHEIAHALQYLTTGDLMMLSSVELNPEVTKEEAYLINPTEMYARVHGNIPYLIKIFDHYLGSLKANPIIYEAAKEQWITEMQDSLVHLSLGGTNTQRLLEDIAKERSHFGTITDKRGRTFRIPDPTASANKTLERQRKRLEEMFYDLYQVQGRRDFRLSLLKARTKLKNQIEAFPLDSPQRLNLEQELAEVDKQIIESGRYLVFDVKDVSESVMEGYLADYFGKLSNAVSEGLLDSDVINPEGVEQKKEKTEIVEEEIAQPPTAKDIRDIARHQIQMTEEIPAGRRLDVVLPRYKSEGRPPGYFPQDKKEEAQGVTIKLVPEKEDEEDKFTETRKAEYNHKKFVSNQKV